MCSGGDTTRQTEQWVSQEIMSSKAELLQEIMMAASESNFFASAPIFLQHLESINTSSQKVDLIIYAFTLTGVALMCGEKCGIPAAGFCMQPTCMPSDDPDWHAIIPVNGGGLSFVEELEAKLFTSHTSLKIFRSVFTDWPFSSLSLNTMRLQLGLQPSETWRAAFKWQACDGTTYPYPYQPLARITHPCSERAAHDLAISLRSCQSSYQCFLTRSSAHRTGKRVFWTARRRLHPCDLARPREPRPSAPSCPPGSRCALAPQALAVRLDRLYLLALLGAGGRRLAGRYEALH